MSNSFESGFSGQNKALLELISLKPNIFFFFSVLYY